MPNYIYNNNNNAAFETNIYRHYFFYLTINVIKFIFIFKKNIKSFKQKIEKKI